MEMRNDDVDDDDYNNESEILCWSINNSIKKGGKKHANAHRTLTRIINNEHSELGEEDFQYIRLNCVCSSQISFHFHSFIMNIYIYIIQRTWYTRIYVLLTRKWIAFQRKISWHLITFHHNRDWKRHTFENFISSTHRMCIFLAGRETTNTKNIYAYM